jgi:hypothetical protein
LAILTLTTIARADADRDPTLEDVLHEIAGVVAPRIKAEKQSAVRVKGFDDDFDDEKREGAKIRDLLIKELTALNIEVRGKASLLLSGTYSAAATTFEGENKEFPGAVIHFKLTLQGNDDPLIDTSRKASKIKPGQVTDPISVAKMVGVNLETKPNDPEKTKEKVLEAVKSPSKSSSGIDVDGTKVRPEKGSKFAVEILVAMPEKTGVVPPASAFAPVRPALRDGVPYVRIQKGGIYRVNIYNENDFAVVGALSIDGLDMFRFSEDHGKRSRFWFFGKGQSYPLVGWHRAGDHYDSFLVGEFVKGQSELLADNEATLSKIEVEFCAAWTNDAEIPDDELTPAEKADRTKRTNKGVPFTLRGADTQLKTTNVKANIGKTRALVTIRYDDYPDLPKK